MALLFRVRILDEAIRLANDVPFGLGASAWTRDRAERDGFVAEIEAGMVFINAMVASDPRVPVRRGQGVGLRAGAEALRHPRVRQHQDRLGRVSLAAQRPSSGVLGYTSL